MPRFRKPFYRESRKLWYVWHQGKQVNLGPEEAEAYRAWHRLLGNPEAPAAGPQEPTVVEVLDYCLTWCEKNTEPSTFRSYRERLQSFVDYLKAMSLLGLLAGELRPHHVIAWADSHADWSPGMKRGRIGAVQRAYNVAVEDGVLADSPVKKVRKPAAGRRENPVSLDTYRTMLKTTSAGFRDLITLAWESGARPQELFRVEARHVDLENARWVFEVKTSKGKKRVRVVYLNEVALDITRRLVKKHPTGKLFRNRDGEPWNKQSVGCVFYRLQKRLGGKRYALYDLRHAWATRALKAGVGVVAVANLMGHSSPRTVSTVYQHLDLDPGHLRDTFGTRSRSSSSPPTGWTLGTGKLFYHPRSDRSWERELSRQADLILASDLLVPNKECVAKKSWKTPGNTPLQTFHRLHRVHQSCQVRWILVHNRQNTEGPVGNPSGVPDECRKL